MDTDVLIVGAGPTGLMLAVLLGRLGVRAMIIDRHPGPSLQTRALGVQARTLDIKLHAIDGRKRSMWRSGFTERQVKPFLCMIPTPGDRRFLDPDRWYYTGADSDLDTLEVQPAPRRPVTGVKADRPTIPLPPA